MYEAALKHMISWMLVAPPVDPAKPKRVAILASNPAVFHPAEKIHQLLAYALFALAGLPAAGALYHHFVRRDGILLRMMPGWTGLVSPQSEAGARRLWSVHGLNRQARNSLTERAGFRPAASAWRYERRKHLEGSA